MTLTLEAGGARAAQFAFHLGTLVMLALVIRRFVLPRFSRAVWTREELWLLILMALPRLFMIVCMPFAANESSGNAWEYFRASETYLSSELRNPPGYGYMLRIARKFLTGHLWADVYPIMAAQHAMGVLTAWTLFRWVRPTSRFAAWFVSIAWGLMPITMLSEHAARPEFFVTFLLCLTIALIGRYEARFTPFHPSPREGEGKGGGSDGLPAWAGIAFGWAVLGRRNMIPVAAAPLLYLFFTRRDRGGRWLRPALMFGGAAAAVVGAYLTLNHYPVTGSFRWHQSLSGNLQKVVSEGMTVAENPFVRELLDVHHDVGAYLRHLEASGVEMEKLIPQLHETWMRKTWPEIEREREDFRAFRLTVSDADLADHRDLSRIGEFYPRDRLRPPDYFEEVGGFYYYGYLEMEDLTVQALLHAIRQHPGSYLRNVVHILPAIFFQKRVDEPLLPDFLAPPSPDGIHIARSLPLGFVLAERHSRGVFWLPGLKILRGFAWMGKLEMMILALLFPMAALWVGFRLLRNRDRVPPHVVIALCVFLAHLPGIAVGGAFGRVFSPAYPFTFLVVAYVLQSVWGRILGTRETAQPTRDHP